MFSCYFRFFGAYHGIRKALKLYVPLAPEMNVAAAAAACFVPMSLMPTMRPMIPYGIMMVILDAVNGINDI